MTSKKGTIFYHNWRPALKKLSRAQRGDILMAILDFDADGIVPDSLDPMTDLAFTNFVEVVKMDREKYEAACEKKAEYYRKKKAEKEEKTIEDYSVLQNTIEDYRTLSDIDIEKDIDIEIDKEMEMEKDIDKDIDSRISTIIREWNYRKYKKAAITGIPFGQKRYNDTFTCIAQYGFGPFMDEIRQLDSNAFFESWHPSYDWFCNPNNFVKVMEGNYREKRKDPNEIDWEAL